MWALRRPAFTEKGPQLLRARGFVTEVQVLAIDARVVIGAAAVSSAPRRVRVPQPAASPCFNNWLHACRTMLLFVKSRAATTAARFLKVMMWV